jgi:uncharacterized protein YdhG (YjbR/CyaY superfamily)
MAKTDFQSVDDYIAIHPPPVQAILQRVRAAIRKAIPDADEVISYQIAAFKLEGRSVLWFAGWKEHYSLYPATARLVEALGDALEPYELSKGTIRFPFDRPIPIGLIRRIAKLRAAEVAEVTQAKRAGSTRPAPKKKSSSGSGSGKRRHGRAK